ncbi:MAG: hypothetical protein RIB60_06225 [Phycisphaerales bacterium]
MPRPCAPLALLLLSASVATADTGDELYTLTGATPIFGLGLGSNGAALVVYDPPSIGLQTYDAPTGAPLGVVGGGPLPGVTNFYKAAISGPTAIVGAISAEVNTIVSGAAYVIDVQTGALLHTLTPDDAASDDRFGVALDIAGDRAIVGSFRNNAGRAYIYDTATGQQLHALDPDPGTPAPHAFGRAVAITGDVALVAAPSESPPAVYIFDIETGQQLGKLTRPGGLGTALAAHADRAVIAHDSIREPALYDLSDPPNPMFITTLTPTGPYGTLGTNTFDRTPYAIDDNAVVIGADLEQRPDGILGVAHLFDARIGSYATTLVPTDPAASRAGSSVAVSNGIAHVGSRGAVSSFDVSIVPCNAADLARPFGTLNVDDIDALVAGFLSAELDVADCDGSGVLNVDDIDCFVASFLAGCL